MRSLRNGIGEAFVSVIFGGAGLLSLMTAAALVSVLVMPPQAKAVPLPPSTVTLGGRVGEDTGDGFLDLLAPFAAYKTGLVYLNPRFSLADGGANEFNLGLGVRQLLGGEKYMIGGNVYYDYRHSQYDNNFNQFGAGVEFFSKWVDARANYYQPEGKIEKIGETETIDTSVSVSKSSSASTHVGDPYVSGSDIKRNVTTRRTTKTTTTTTTVRELFEQFESGMQGWDAEIGFLIPLNSIGKKKTKLPETRIFGGYYQFEDEFNQEVEGAKGRLEVRATHWLKLDAEVFEDRDLNEADWFLGARVETPLDWGGLFGGKGKKAFPSGKRETYASSMVPRLNEMVMRDARIQLEDSPVIQNEEETKVTQEVSTQTSTSARTSSETVMDDIAWVDCEKEEKSATGEEGEEAGDGPDVQEGSVGEGVALEGGEGDGGGDETADASGGGCVEGTPGCPEPLPSGDYDDPFHTIRDAVDSGADNVVVKGGSYHENVKLPKGTSAFTLFNLIGEGDEHVHVDGYLAPDGWEGSNATFWVTGDNTIAGFKISNMENEYDSKAADLPEFAPEEVCEGNCAEIPWGDPWGPAIYGKRVHGDIEVTGNKIFKSYGAKITSKGGRVLFDDNTFWKNERRAIEVVGKKGDVEVIVTDNRIRGVKPWGYYDPVSEGPGEELNALEGFGGLEELHNANAKGIWVESKWGADVNTLIAGNTVEKVGDFYFGMNSTGDAEPSEPSNGYQPGIGVGIGVVNSGADQTALVEGNRVGRTAVGLLAHNTQGRFERWSAEAVVNGPGNGDNGFYMPPTNTLNVTVAGNEFGFMKEWDGGWKTAADEAEAEGGGYGYSPVMVGIVAANAGYISDEFCENPDKDQVSEAVLPIFNPATLNIDVTDNTVMASLLGSVNVNLTEGYLPYGHPRSLSEIPDMPDVQLVPELNATMRGNVYGYLEEPGNGAMAADFDQPPPMWVGHLDVNVGAGALNNTFDDNVVLSCLLGYGAVNVEPSFWDMPSLELPPLPGHWDGGGELPFPGLPVGNLVSMAEEVLGSGALGGILDDVGAADFMGKMGPGELHTTVSNNLFARRAADFGDGIDIADADMEETTGLVGAVIANLGMGHTTAMVTGNNFETYLGQINVNWVPNMGPIKKGEAEAEVNGDGFKYGTLESTHSGNCTGCHVGLSVVDVNVGQGNLYSTVNENFMYGYAGVNVGGGGMTKDLEASENGYGGMLVSTVENNTIPSSLGIIDEIFGDAGAAGEGFDFGGIGIVVANVGDGTVYSRAAGNQLGALETGCGDPPCGGNALTAGYVGLNYGYNGNFFAVAPKMEEAVPGVANDNGMPFEGGIYDNTFFTAPYYSKAVALYNYGGGKMKATADGNSIYNLNFDYNDAAQTDVPSGVPFHSLSTGIEAVNIGDGFLHAKFTNNDIGGMPDMMEEVPDGEAMDAHSLFVGPGLGISVVNFSPHDPGRMVAKIKNNNIYNPAYGGIFAENYVNYGIDNGDATVAGGPEPGVMELLIDGNLVSHVEGVELAGDGLFEDGGSFGIGVLAPSYEDVNDRHFSEGLLGPNASRTDLQITNNRVLSGDTPDFGIVVEARDMATLDSYDQDDLVPVPSPLAGIQITGNTVEGAEVAAIEVLGRGEGVDIEDNLQLRNNTVKYAHDGIVVKLEEGADAEGFTAIMNNTLTNFVGSTGIMVLAEGRRSDFEGEVNVSSNTVDGATNAITVGTMYDCGGSCGDGPDYLSNVTIDSNTISNVGTGIGVWIDGPSAQIKGDLNIRSNTIDNVWAPQGAIAVAAVQGGDIGDSTGDRVRIKSNTITDAPSGINLVAVNGGSNVTAEVNIKYNTIGCDTVANPGCEGNSGITVQAQSAGDYEAGVNVMSNTIDRVKEAIEVSATGGGSDFQGDVNVSSNTISKVSGSSTAIGLNASSGGDFDANVMVNGNTITDARNAVNVTVDGSGSRVGGYIAVNSNTITNPTAYGDNGIAIVVQNGADVFGAVGASSNTVSRISGTGMTVRILGLGTSIGGRGVVMNGNTLTMIGDPATPEFFTVGMGVDNSSDDSFIVNLRNNTVTGEPLNLGPGEFPPIPTPYNMNYGIAVRDTGPGGAGQTTVDGGGNTVSNADAAFYFQNNNTPAMNVTMQPDTISNANIGYWRVPSAAAVTGSVGAGTTYTNVDQPTKTGP